ncbi:MAG TPA: cobalamin-binding protein [Burkholderiales bacterium]|jgi:iron complex transport system substrate-binding protein|nr:cobalamin-binding protein [Burkholderiales bacterium]
MRLVLLLLAWFWIEAFAAVQVTDDYGNEVRLASPAARIVSLSPHLTELLYAAGAGGRVVGALEYSDYPPEARALPRVGSDAGIDLEAVIALQPDLVVAWPNAGSLRAVNRLADVRLPVFRSEPRELDDIARTLERLGALAGTQKEAGRASADFRARVRELRARYSKRAPVRVFYQVWDRPLVTVNGKHVITKVMRLCGGVNVFERLPLIAPEIDREAVLRADPQVIVASGPDGERPAWLDAWKAFPGLTAAAHGNLYAIAPELIQRHTPRILHGAERLCRILDEVRARS